MFIPQAKKKVLHLIEAGLQVLLVGAPGIGKTDIVRQAAAHLGYHLIISHPVTSDPTDFKGLAFLVDGGNGKEARFLPIGQMVELMSAQEKTIWFLDDLGQALPAVQAALMQLVHRRGRQLGQHKISDTVRIIAATNRADDGAMVRGLLSPLRSRFQFVLPVEADLNAWIPYAIDKKVDPRIIGFLKWQQHLGHDRFMVHNGDITDISQVCCPRSWTEAVNPLLALGSKLFTDADDRCALLCAAIGEAVGLEFDKFLEAESRMVSIPDILANPQSAPLPGDLDLTYMTVSGLAHRAITHDSGPQEVGAMAEYVARLHDELAELFRFTLAQTRRPELIEHRAVVALTAQTAV